MPHQRLLLGELGERRGVVGLDRLLLLLLLLDLRRRCVPLQLALNSSMHTANQLFSDALCGAAAPCSLCCCSVCAAAASVLQFVLQRYMSSLLADTSEAEGSFFLLLLLLYLCLCSCFSNPGTQRASRSAAS